MTLNQLIERIPEAKQPSAKQIVRELGFLNRTLAKLRKTIDEQGPIEHFINGKQDFWRESPALKSYNASLARFSTLHKQLVALLPDDQPAEELDELDKFLMGIED